MAAQTMLLAVSRKTEPPQDPLLKWAWTLVKRKNRNVAAVAIAAKLARIAWALLTKQTDYQPTRNQGQMQTI